LRSGTAAMSILGMAVFQAISDRAYARPARSRPSTSNPATLRLLIADVLLCRNTPDQVRDWINGFNLMSNTCGCFGRQMRVSTRRRRRSHRGGPCRPRAKAARAQAQRHADAAVLCDFCHASELLRNGRTSAPIFCCLCAVDYKWGCLYEISSRQALDRPRGSQDKREPGGRIL
jgi:hypothetical protein